MRNAIATTYVPPPGSGWESRRPAELGASPQALRDVAAFHASHETAMPRNIGAHLEAALRDVPFGDVIGPTRDRGGVNGLVVRRGYIIAEWGDTDRADMSFSVTKSLLSAVAGLAYDRGLIAGVDRRVADRFHGEAFESPQNASITWHHLLQQTSEWEGTLWGKPDVADRRRGSERALQEPGSFWEYNDVRVNLLALQLTRLFGEELPSVLRDAVMDPLGATADWSWHGYDASNLDVDGRRLRSVSGGGHWGGGMWIGTRDLARLGLLYLRRGSWGGRRILSEDWIDRTLTPCPQAPNYGYLWWLNTDQGLFPDAPPGTFAAIGGNRNLLWVVPELDLVVAVRWIAEDVRAEFIARVVASIDDAWGQP